MKINNCHYCKNKFLIENKLFFKCLVYNSVKDLSKIHKDIDYSCHYFRD